jgi:hypothetical protein
MILIIFINLWRPSPQIKPYRRCIQENKGTPFIEDQTRNVHFLENDLTDSDYVLIIYRGNGPK